MIFMLTLFLQAVHNGNFYGARFYQDQIQKDIERCILRGYVTAHR